MDRRNDRSCFLRDKWSDAKGSEKCESNRWATYNSCSRETGTIPVLSDRELLSKTSLQEPASTHTSGTKTEAPPAQRCASAHEPKINSRVPDKVAKQLGQLRYEAGEQQIQMRQGEQREAILQPPARQGGLQLPSDQQRAQERESTHQKSWKPNLVDSTAEAEREENRTAIPQREFVKVSPSSAISQHTASNFKEKHAAVSFSPLGLNMSLLELDHHTRRDDFRTYWECALQKFGVSEDGMLLKSGAKELGFSDADGEEVLRIITQSSLREDAGTAVVPTWTRHEDVEFVTTANKELFEKLPSCLFRKAGLDASCETGTNSCLLQSLHLIAGEKAKAAAGLGTNAVIEPFHLMGGRRQTKDSKSAGEAVANIETEILGGNAIPINVGVGQTLLAANLRRDSTEEGAPRAGNLIASKRTRAEQEGERGETGKKRNPFKRVLELGAGIGRLTKLLQNVADEVVAVDFIREYVEENRKANGDPVQRGQDRFVVADATKLEFPLRPSSLQTVFLPDGREVCCHAESLASEELSCLPLSPQQHTNLSPPPCAPASDAPSASRADQQESRSADVSHEKFDLLVINWLLMYLSIEEVRRLVRNLIASWSTTHALVFVRESCGEPSDRGKSSREWAKSGNPTVYRGHQVYTSLIEEEARRAGVEIEFVAKSRPMQVYWKKGGTDSQRYWVLRVKG